MVTAIMMIMMIIHIVHMIIMIIMIIIKGQHEHIPGVDVGGARVQGGAVHVAGYSMI